MNRSTLAGIVVAFLLTLAIGISGVIFLSHQKPRTKKAPIKELSEISGRKIAYISDPDYLIREAEKAEKKGDWQEALMWYRLATYNLAKGDAIRGYVQYRKAYCRYQLGDYVGALGVLEWTLNHYQAFPHLDDALFLMAQLYTKVGDFEKAYKTYNTIIRIFPSRAEEAKSKQKNLPYPQKK